MTDERNQRAENHQTQALDIPLFPLRAVLFPGGTLPLRIFEPRYVDMIRWCMREGKGFGVVLLREGSDVLDAKDPDSKAKEARIYDVGTQAHIIDFDQADNGLLGIAAQGGEKFSVIETDVARDGLMRAQVRLLSEPAQPLSERYDPMVSVLRDLLAHPLIQELNPQVDFHEDRSVSHRVADLLPIAPEAKQWLLEMPTPEARLVELEEIIKQLAD